MKTIKLIQNTCKFLIFMFLLIFTGNSISAQNCQGKTLTIGGWGAPNTSNPNVSYLYANFNGAFPNGVVVGCVGGKTLSLTSPQAITDFLPSGGTASPLNNNYVNPGSGYSNVLAGQLVAVMLAVGFDNYDEGFSSATANLADFVFVSGPFQGMTVSQFLALANNFMGGCGTSQYSATQFNDAAAAINLNYDEGNVDLGYLSCCSLKIHVSYDPILCHGGTTTVHVTATGGSSNVQGVGDFVVGAGTHNFTVSDGNCSDSTSIVIGEPPLLTVNIGNTPVLCHGGLSTLTANVSGGTGSYTYLWSNGAMTPSIQVLAGTYSVTVTDQNSCSKTASVTVSEPEQLMVSIGSTPILCHGGMSTLTANASGGTGSYSYLWSNGEMTPSIQVLAGTYSVTVTDQNGCTASASVTMTEPEELLASIESTPILCHGGLSTLTVNASGGTGSYSYLWSNGATTPSIQVLAGTYSVTVTDENSCSKTVSVTITEPEKLMVNIDSTPILCNGGMSTLTANASGGTGSYSYLWSNGAMTPSIQVLAGTYSVTVTDQNACSASASITITQPEALGLIINKSDVTCVGGTASVSANVTGGTPAYSYLWSNGATAQTVNLPVGNFSVTVTDSNGCTISQSFEVKLLTCNGFTTVTQGGWGAKASGNNWGAYRDLNFAAAFPIGLTIGAGSRFLKLTTAKAVDDFLPSGTTARALNAGTLVNPGSGYKNVLAGQVVALTLNLRFDQVNPSFSSSSTWLGDLIVISGTFTGWTVSQVLAEANNVLGGVASSYSADQMNSIVDAINNNYDNGTVNLGMLGCPCASSPTRPLERNSAENGVSLSKPDMAVNDDAKVYPNPTRGEINLSFENNEGGNVSAYLFNSSGRMVADLSRNISRNGNRVMINYQNYSLLEGIYILTVKASKFEKSYKIIIRK
ncbi:T9SS type A sorting domain-containing protein [Chryseobacterium taiwanense]|uniref:PKD/Chitinase domain-containing protein n=1 Tax=Chryseobacterium taiwanense TaxID=363331 RepID=A0A0B4D4B6_9FLAO|nr:T9SS type A sorting domain-containing protein [Chryseobacterium taiwanense]KIC63507.1 hypothetical protein RM51_07505 [Chryseobacterium taiwanense]